MTNFQEISAKTIDGKGIVTMLGIETRKGERRASEIERGQMECEERQREQIKTIDELFHVFLVAQEMGSRLADETHGDLYSKVRRLNELLHQVRAQLKEIKDGHSGPSNAHVVPGSRSR